MKTLILTVILLTSFFTFSQNATIMWQKVYGGSGQDYSDEIIKTNDGGFLVMGRTNSSGGDITGPTLGSYDMWAVKLDSAGNKQWDKSYGGTSIDYGTGVRQTTDGGYIMCGYTLDTVFGGFSFNFLVIKTDASGNVQWENQYGGSDADYADDIIQTSDGGYVVAGYSQSTDNDFTVNAGFFDAWILKLNPNGIVQWASSYGDSLSDRYAKVIETTTGEIMAVGQATDSLAQPGDAPGDYLVSVYSSTGVAQWHKTYGGSFNDNATSILQYDATNFYVGGTSASTDRDVVNPNNGNSDFWAIKINNTGSLLWEKSFGGDSTEIGYDLYKDTDGGLLAAARSISSATGDVSENNQGSPDWWIFKFNTAGVIQWEESFGGNDWEDPASLTQDTDGGVVIAGRSESLNGDVPSNAGQADLWIMKLLQPNSTGYEFNNSEELDVYPNPTNDIINLSIPSFLLGEQLHIYNAVGKVVYSSSILSNKTTLSLNSFTEGSYLIKINSGEKVFLKKIIVTK